ncbi:MAG: hypothetical protein GKS04_02410 [Candidatus Mycalebacterium zealandia]|nr:MAG: hypothetical protein GKS04_02410 [Candidatus Mycalebacterium zealandia]
MAGNIWNLGFFPNLVLISVFIGLGAGFISHSLFSKKTSDVLFDLTAPAVCLFVFLIYIVSPGVPGFGQEAASFGGVGHEEVFFSAGIGKESVRESIFLFPFWFLFPAAVFFLIAQRTAKVFMKMKPLAAYSFDILGSCFGIAAFICISFFEINAGVWFLICIPIFLMAKSPDSSARKTATAIIAVSMLVASFQVFYEDRQYDDKVMASVWSPYQKVDMDVNLKVYVNKIDHQEIRDNAPDISLYGLVHVVRREKSLPHYKRVLVIGAGTGNDVSSALYFGAEEVTAVEIDPVIARLVKHHPTVPYYPYSSQKVDLVIDDGRHFMTATDKKYDLIVFALTDSLVKQSSLSQIRLESYLFTQQSFSHAWSLLEEGGTLMAVNFYREPWIPWKIGEMMKKVSGTVPVLHFPIRSVKHHDLVTETIVLAGKTSEGTSCIEISSKMTCLDLVSFEKFLGKSKDLPLPSDDWPFLYIAEKHLPSIYIYAMLFILAFVGLLLGLLRAVQAWAPRAQGMSLPMPRASVCVAFLLMGAAFLLLETKSIIQFSLLFGNTWLNSSLVFLAVLVLVLAANWVAAIIKSDKLVPAAFFLLLLSCLPALVIPTDTLLAVDNVPMRFVFASIVTFLPIFFANMVFSSIFRKQKFHEIYFGWNLVGAVGGGMLEYTSILVGYQFLALIVLSIYAVVFALYYLRIAPGFASETPTPEAGQ